MAAGRHPWVKKLVSSLTAVVLVVGLMPYPAFAEVGAAPSSQDGQSQLLTASSADLTAQESPSLTAQATTSITSWDALQTSINNSSSGDVIKLDGEIINTQKKDRIKVDGKTVTIDLNGHQLNRNRTSSDVDGHVIQVMNGANLTIQDSVGGGTIKGGYAKRGGGINIDASSTCTIAGGTVTGNSASIDGGGIYVRGTLNMTGGTISGNHADDTAGGIYVADTGTINLNNATISSNTAKNNGGGMNMHLKDDSSIIKNSSISNNTSGEYGGGLRLDAEGRTLKIEGTVIEGNKSSDDGAGIYLHYGTIEMTGGRLHKNVSKNDGGGAKITRKTTFKANGVTISENEAENEEGGGVKNQGITELKNCTVSGNSAQKPGGGVFNDDDVDGGADADLTLENCTIELNRSDAYGGGVYSDKKLAIKGGTITKNHSADGRGNGVFIGKDSKPTTIEGKVVIQGNDLSKNGQELFLRPGQKLKFSGNLVEGAKIGITLDTDDGLGTFTDGLGAIASIEPADYFFSPEGYDVWVPIGETEAQLVSSWPALQKQINDEPNGATVTLYHNYGASPDDDQLKIPKNKTLTIDLNGFTLNRNLSDDDSDGHVIEVLDGANLTIKDSSAKGGSVGTGTITGGYATRGGGINISQGATCTIAGGTISGNKADVDGGGIYVHGTLNMTGGTISGNHADDTGGGIYVADTGTINLNNAVISSNIAYNRGGGINMHLASDAEIANCSITGNRTWSDVGGGLHMDAKGKTLTISDSHIDKNTSGDNGGGIYLNSGAIIMEGGTVSENTAACDSGGVKATSKTTFTAENVTISDNKAEGEEGGGLKNQGTMTLTHCTVSGNSAKKQGGGIFNDNDGDSAGDLTIDGCTITGNKTDSDGGGIYSDKKLTIKGDYIRTMLPLDIVTISGNSAEKGRGGGIFIGKDSEKASIEGVISVAGNAADMGKDLYLRSGQKLTVADMISGPDNGMGPVVGNLDMEEPGVFTSGYATWNGGVDPSGVFNTADGAIPAEWNKNKKEARLKSSWPDLQKKIDDAAQGGTITLSQSYTASSDDVQLKIPKNKTITINLDGYTLDRNLSSESEGGNVIEVLKGASLTIRDGEDGGGTITGGYAKYGGGIYINEEASLTIEGGAITGNKAGVDGGGIFVDGYLETKGGTYDPDEKVLVKPGGSITGNYAGDTGGGIYVSTDGSFMLQNADISHNAANNNGGGLNIHLAADSYIRECTITDNEAGDYGGGLRMDAKGRELSISGTRIDDNTSEDDGAGVYLHNGTINMSEGSISNNSTLNDGGGAKITSKTTFVANGVTISDNRASTEQGGGIKNYGTTSLGDCTITGNSAADLGGGIFNDNDDDSAGDLTLVNCTIKGNSTQANGGGVYSDKKLTIIGGTVSENTANDRGGGIFVGGDSSATNVEGKLVVKNNTAGTFGNDLFLRSGRKLACTGTQTDKPTLEGAEIHVDMESGTGTLTSGYSMYSVVDGQVVSPVGIFVPAKGYTVELDKDGKEVVIGSNWNDLKSKVEAAKPGEPTTITLDQDYAAKPSDDRIKVKKGAHVIIDLAGHTVNRNRQSSDDDGHVFEVFGELTICDNSATADAPGTGTITGGWAKNGGGINIGEEGTLNLQGGTVSGNKASEDGGGIYVHGTLNMIGGAVKDNRADEDGGGIATDSGSTINLQGGEVSDNKASKVGGGIVVNKSAAISVQGSPVVKGNKALTGNGVYLPKDKKIEVTGVMGDSAEIGVALENDWGEFTSGYGTNNGAADPAVRFTSTQGYTVRLQGSEAVLERERFGETEYENPFISWKDQVNADTSGLSSVNWMAGISGERYLNEINMPGSHDSGMNNIEELDWLEDCTSVIACLAYGVASDYAKTQIHYIDEHIADGARQIDVRLRNEHKVEQWWGGYRFEDDGENLWLCHGKKGGGTYFAQNDDDKDLTFAEVLGWAMDFLAKHPTETIILDLRPESESAGQMTKIYKRARTILETLALQTNPSTGEPYLYKEPGSSSYFAQYTHMPQLKDCRGKIVLFPDDDEFISYVGGFRRATFSDELHVLDELDYKQSAGQMVDQATEVYNSYYNEFKPKIPTVADANGSCDYLWYWELNCTGQGHGTWSMIKNYTTGDEPYKLAKEVNPELIGDGKLFSSASTGNYIGWVRMDAFEAKYAEVIWRTNFPEGENGLQYCTVTVKSGLTGAGGEPDSNYPDQTFKVLKGTKITVPGNIYKQPQGTTALNGKYFGSWEAIESPAAGAGQAEGDASAAGTAYEQGETYTVNENVTFTAQWLEDGKIPVKIVWKDGDDFDKLRPSSVNFDATVVTGGVEGSGGTSQSQMIILKGYLGWSAIVEGVITQIVPAWDGIKTTAEKPNGEDKEGEYRYEGGEPQAGDGYVFTFIHTPQVQVDASGVVNWDDEDNVDKLRPSSVVVKLFANGEVAGTQLVKASGGWQYSFGENGKLPLYKDGEKIEYSVAEYATTEDTAAANSIPSYSVAIDGFSITNEHEPNKGNIVNVLGVVEWDDNANAAGVRPESVTVRLQLADGAPVDSQVVELGEFGQWWFEFKDLPFFNLENKKVSYEVTIDEIPGYTSEVIELTPSADGADASVQNTGAYTFRIVNTLDVPKPVQHTVTFYEDAAGTKVWQTVKLDEGAPLEVLEGYGVSSDRPLTKEGYTLAGWATVKNVKVDAYLEPDGETLNPDLAGKLVDWSGTATADVEAYPVWIRDRLEVHLVPGGDEETPVTMGIGYDGEEQAKAFTVDIDEKIDMTGLNTTKRVGYDLFGWFTQGGVQWNGSWGVTPEYCDKDASGEPIVQKNDARKFKYYTVTLMARWTPKKVSVVYEVGSDGTGNVVDSQKYGLGDVITMAAAPSVSEGKTFIGWRDAKSTLNSAGGMLPFVDWNLVGENGAITLIAQYVDTPTVAVKFDSAGGTAVPPVAVLEGTQIETAPVTEWVGHTFAGWFNETQSMVERVAFPFSPVGDTTLKAHWTVNRYTITFDSADGSAVPDITQDYGTQIAAPEDPAKLHYTFDGWHPSLPSTMPARDLAVAATWTPTVYYAKFVDGVSEGVSVSGIYGAAIEAPADPTRENYVFSGWVDAHGQEVVFPLYMPDTGLTQDSPTVYSAKWKPVQDAPMVSVEAVNAHAVRVVAPVLGAEYVIMPKGQLPAAKDWADARRTELQSLTFDGLDPLSEYDVWARMCETNLAAQSPETHVTVKTKAVPEASAPQPAGSLVYAGSPQFLATPGSTSGGMLEYALGASGEKPPAEGWGDSVPQAIDAGDYFVWWRVVADTDHEGIAPACMEASIGKASQTVEASDVEGAEGEAGKAVTATVTGVDGTVSGVGALSFAVASGSDVVSVDPSTGALTLLSEGSATVSVTAAETGNYNAATKAVAVTVTAAVEPPLPGDDISYASGSGDRSWTKGSQEALSFTFHRSQDDAATFGHFTGLTVDNQDLPQGFYSARSGSVMIELLPDYLESLAVGTHTLQPTFNDGEAVAVDFTIVETSKPDDGSEDKPDDNGGKPDTGDNGKSDADDNRKSDADGTGKSDADGNGKSDSGASGSNASSGDSGTGTKGASTASKGSSSSAKTGDAIPVAVVCALALISLVTAFVARRKRNEGGRGR